MSGDAPRDRQQQHRRLVPNPKSHSKARFPPRRSTATPTKMASPSAATTPRFEEIIDDGEDVSKPETTAYFTSPPASAHTYMTWNPSNRYVPPPSTPDLYTTLPILRDGYTTHTSREQDKTTRAVLPLLASKENPLPHLDRFAHIEFMEGGVDGEALPPGMTTLDASRGWIVYWCINGLSLLGMDVSMYRSRWAPPPAPPAPR